ncbi:hypothetical protein PF010_g2705 [Phytophthora fragariae]|uniref:Uncharacterized protein n=1 Tax=Phytophthora fragariae TaxID=53985 RepID=A0A6G0LWB4_9STRA|nr:hypothetical protein PF010_g2705 [Phytophthora fragariae]
MLNVSARRSSVVAISLADENPSETLVVGSSWLLDLLPEKLVAGGGTRPKLVVGDSSPEKLVVVGNSLETLIMAIVILGELAAGAA